MTIKANISGLRETSRNMGSYRKENGFYREIAALDPATGRAVVTARIYIPGSTSYCALWVSGKAYGRGLGKAGGYGYHRPSAALAEAIRDAGIVLRGNVYSGQKPSNELAHIGGVGDSIMLEAVQAIARAVTGKRRFIVHVAHA